MSLKSSAIVLVLLSLTLGAAAQTIVPNVTYPAGPPVVVSGPNTISTGNNSVTVSNGATVTYKANASIALKPGFYVATGATFSAQIDSDGDGLSTMQEAQLGTNPNIADTDGDGLPDGWEFTQGWNPIANDATVDPDGDGLGRVREYFLGTNAAVDDRTATTVLKLSLPGGGTQNVTIATLGLAP